MKLIIFLILLFATPCFAGDTILSEWIEVEYTENYIEQQQDGVDAFGNPVYIYIPRTRQNKKWIPQIGAESQNGKYTNAPCKWNRLVPVDKLPLTNNYTLVDVVCPKSTDDNIKSGVDHVLIEEGKTVDVTNNIAINQKLGTSLNLTGMTKDEATKALIPVVKNFKAKQVVIGEGE